MTHELLLGHADEGGTPVALNVEALISTHLCIQANAGGGKSQTIRKVMELAEGHAQRIVLDVEDEFHTLREASQRMVIAGPDGDCPANLSNAAALPLFLLETGLDAVIQINGLGLEGRRQFIALFLNALIAAPRHLWHPVLVALDETHRYAPEGAREASSHAVAALASEGRKRGFTAIFATQRLAKISKDATGDINNWLMGRAGQAVDRERVADELGMRKASPEVRHMGRLAPGHFWAIGPALTPEPVLVHVGKVKTTHLRSGQRAVPVPPGAHEIRAMMAKLHVEPPPAPEAKAGVSHSSPSNEGAKSDVVGIVAELRAQLGTEYARGRGEGHMLGIVDGAARVNADAQAALCAAVANLREVAADLTEFADDLAGVGADLDELARRASDRIPASIAKAPLTTKTAELTTKAPVPEGKTARRSTPTGNGVGSSPTGGTKDVAQRVVDALAELRAMGITAPSREIVAFLVGYSNPRSMSFANAVAELVTIQHVTIPAAGLLEITNTGIKHAAAIAPRSGADLRARIVEMLGNPSGRILEMLVSTYPSSISREILATHAGYSNPRSMSFANAISRLETLGFASYPAPRQVVATPLLFAGA